MIDAALVILTILGVAVAIAGVARFTRGGAKGMRIFLCLLAGLATLALFGALHPPVKRYVFERNDDYAWSNARAIMIRQNPALTDVFALDPAVEAEFRARLLPVFREHLSSPSDPAMREDAAKAIATVYRAKVYPKAVEGSDEAVAAWGQKLRPLLEAFRGVSDDACGDYAMTGLNRWSPNPRIDVALADVQRAVAAAYKSSDPANKLAPAEELGAAYEQARTLAQPPFDDADMRSFGDLKNQPKARQCELMLRLFAAIERLPVKQKAAIYRTIMANS